MCTVHISSKVWGKVKHRQTNCKHMFIETVGFGCSRTTQTTYCVRDCNVDKTFQDYRAELIHNLYHWFIVILQSTKIKSLSVNPKTKSLLFSVTQVLLSWALPRFVQWSWRDFVSPWGWLWPVCECSADKSKAAQVPVPLRRGARWSEVPAQGGSSCLNWSEAAGM